MVSACTTCSGLGGAGTCATCTHAHNDTMTGGTRPGALLLLLLLLRRVVPALGAAGWLVDVCERRPDPGAVRTCRQRSWVLAMRKR